MTTFKALQKIIRRGSWSLCCGACSSCCLRPGVGVGFRAGSCSVDGGGDLLPDEPSAGRHRYLQGDRDQYGCHGE